MGIKCLKGGNVTKGGDFDWENPDATECDISDCDDFLTRDHYKVPPATGGKPGTKPAKVRNDVEEGDYIYSAMLKGDKTRTNPTMTVKAGS
jgi:hypothetical protein